MTKGRILKPDNVENVQRYDLWMIPEFPVNVPLVRPRSESDQWRINLLESIRKEGMRHPIIVFGHSPKGEFNMDKWGDAQEGRDPRMYIAYGTNRYWAIQQLGWETFPAIMSWNKGTPPPFEGEIIQPGQFKQYSPPGSRVFVQDHAFGWSVKLLPEDEFE